MDFRITTDPPAAINQQLFFYSSWAVVGGACAFIDPFFISILLWQYVMLLFHCYHCHHISRLFCYMIIWMLFRGTNCLVWHCCGRELSHLQACWTRMSHLFPHCFQTEKPPTSTMNLISDTPSYHSKARGQPAPL